MKQLNHENRPMASADSVARKSLRSKRSSMVAAISVSVMLLGGGYAVAETPSKLQQLGRLIGAGWGDGYHACKCSGNRPCADLPPRPYCYGNCDGQCGQTRCDECGGFSSGFLGNVNETGLLLKARAHTTCNNTQCQTPHCNLDIRGQVNETGLALKVPGRPQYSTAPCTLPPCRPRLRIPSIRQPECDASCDVGPHVENWSAAENPESLNLESSDLESSDLESLNFESSDLESLNSEFTHPAQQTMPVRVLESPVVEVPADSAMNQTKPHLAPPTRLPNVTMPAAEPEKRMAVSILAPPEPTPEPAKQIRRPVRIAQGNIKSKSTIRIAISQPLDSKVKINHFADEVADVAPEAKPAPRSPQRLPLIR